MKVKGRAADNLQHVGSNRLLLECLGKIVGALAQFAEQACVFDGDDGLVGEGRDQFDLLLRKRLCLVLAYEDDADDVALAQERNAEPSPVASYLLNLTERVFGIRQHVGDMNRPALEGCTARDAAAIDRHWQVLKELPDLRVTFGRIAVAGRKYEVLALALKQPCVIRIAQSGRRTRPMCRARFAGRMSND